MDEFVDYYEVLQISPNAELATIQTVYRMLAGRYHPDNRATGNADRFIKVQEAYELLSSPELRAAYDEDHKLMRAVPLTVLAQDESTFGFDSEVKRRLSVLCILYNQRRDDSSHPTISILDLASMITVKREQLEFSAWYLREKGYIRRDDHGEFTITAEGVDYVEEHRHENPIMMRLLMPPTVGVKARTQ